MWESQLNIFSLSKWHGICLKFSHMMVSSVWNIIYQFNNTMVNGMASKLLVTFADYFLSGVFFIITIFNKWEKQKKNISELGRDNNYRTCNAMKYFCSEYNIMCS